MAARVDRTPALSTGPCGPTRRRGETLQRAIFDALEYTVSADGTSLEVVDCGPIYARASEADQGAGFGEDDIAQIRK